MLELKEIIEKFKPYTNISILHDMPGYKYKYFECSCGYKEHVVNENIIQRCPMCNSKTFRTGQLSFDRIEDTFSVSEAIPFNNKDFYRFGILLSQKDINYSINFSKKIFKDFNSSISSLLVFFDGYERNKDNIIRFINMDNETEISKREFLELTRNREIFNLSYIDSSRYKKFSYESYSYMSIHTLLNILNNMRISFYSNPYYEILVKAGIDPYEVSSGFDITINKKGKSPSEILGIKKYSLNKLKKYKDKYLAIREIEEQLGSKMVQYYDIFVNDPDWGNDALSSDVVEKIAYISKNTGLALNKLHDYINNCFSKQYMFSYTEPYILNLYYDSLIMAEQLQIPFDKTPRSLRRYHDVLSKECRLIEDEIKSSQLAKEMSKYNMLELVAEKDEEGNFSEKYSIILPRNIQDVINEGKTMHHCVGSYVDRIIRGQSIILFLRRSEDINGKSVATFEVNPKSKGVVQIQAPYNQRPEQPAIDFIKKWCKKHEIEINKY